MVNGLHEESSGDRGLGRRKAVGVLFVRMAPSRSFSYLLGPVEDPLWESEGPPD